MKILLIRLRKWFPPDDEIANSIARLCVLKEDLRIEIEGIRTENISILDGNTSTWRKLYFLRNSVRTLHEIIIAIKSLRDWKELEIRISCFPKEMEKRAKDFYQNIDEYENDIKELRNNLWGGHIGKTGMDAALKKIDDGIIGKIEIRKFLLSSLSKVFYRFGSEFILAYKLGKFPEDKRAEELQELIRKIAALSGSAIPMVDLIVDTYAKKRGLDFM